MSTARIDNDRFGCLELLLKCDCGDLHVSSLSFYPGDKDFLNLHITLRTTRSWYKRWWSAFRYALGIRDRWMYDEMVLTEKDAEDIIAFLQEYLHEEKS